MQPLTLQDIRREQQDLLDALDLIEQHYCHYEIQLVPKPIQQTRSQLMLASVESRESKTNRQLVSEATAGEALDIDAIAEATGLTKTKIRGVLTSPQEKHHYERTELSDGRKLYRYIGE
jgi:hypothetical protein